MRRWIFMAALGAALFVTPLLAQRGGHGGMAMGSARGGYVAHGGGGYVGATHGAYWGGGYRGGYGHGYRYYPGRYPYGWGYRGYGYGWYGYPWFSLGWYGGLGWSDAYYSYPAASYPVYVYPPDDNTSIDYKQQQEIDRLNDEVARLRAEQQSGAAAKPVPQPPEAQIRGDTVLVFRDGHSEEIENYAIIGKTLWVFTEQRARKVPIAELNVPATTKANEARGIDFRVPTQ